MTGAALRALFLELRRDRGAVVMAFLLPVVFFLVFAWIFAGAGGNDLRIRIVVAQAVEDADGDALLEALAEDPGIRILAPDQALDPDRARRIVRAGKADVGLVLRAPLAAPTPGEAPIAILYDPTREVAANMLAGRLQRAFVEALPDVALGGMIQALDAQFLSLDDAQRARVEQGLAALRAAPRTPGQSLAPALTARETVIGTREGSNTVAYYAGAVAILFVLFSAVHGAISLLDDRDAGIIDRILAGPAGTRVLVNARFLFIAAQGFVQIAIIFLVAWLGFGVDLPGHLVGWALTTAAVSLCAAGLSLALVAACNSRRQAQNVSNVAILIVSAVGGSMVPRFFMPPLLQKLGWLTPNTWGLEAYAGVFWRAAPLSSLALPWLLLTGAGVLGLWLARRLVRRWEVI